MESALIIKIWSVEKSEEGFLAPRISDHEFTAGQTRQVSFDDIPADVLLTVPGIAYVTEFCMYPYSPDEDESARGFALKFAKKQMATLGGVIEELLPGGERNVYRENAGTFLYPALNEYTAKMSLSVWYAPTMGFDSIAAGVVDVFEKYMPYALPSAYGREETPENVCGGDGRDFDKEKFVDFLINEPKPVWYARSPIIGVHVRDAVRRDAARKGFRASCLTVEFPEKIYRFPEWGYALRRLLRELAVVCGGFFGQIVSQNGGVASWWWQGIPDELGNACIIGEPYYSLIPDCAGEKATQIGDAEMKIAYFEEPDGPFITSELLSVRRKKLFGKKNIYISPDDFTIAEKLPF